MSTMTLKNAKGEGDFLRLRFWGAVLLMLGALLALGARRQSPPGRDRRQQCPWHRRHRLP